MTLHATRAGQKVTLHANCGISLAIDGAKYVSAEITEDAQHVRWFHTQLGQLLDAADAERAAATAEATG